MFEVDGSWDRKQRIAVAGGKDNLLFNKHDEVRPHFCELLALAFQHVQVCLMMVATELLSHWIQHE